MTREAEFVAARLKAMAKAQAPKMPKGPAAVEPAEQMRRFLAGEERWRVEAGQVTPQEFVEYERAMLRKLAGG